MIGDECPCGRSVFQITFCAGPNSAGSAPASETPETLGPRKRAHSTAGSAASTVTATRSVSKVPMVLFRQRLRRLRQRPHDFCELTPLQQLPSLAASAGDFVLCRADRLLGSAGCL